jgi:hypothetical protein
MGLGNLMCNLIGPLIKIGANCSSYQRVATLVRVRIQMNEESLKNFKDISLLIKKRGALLIQAGNGLGL